MAREGAQKMTSKSDYKRQGSEAQGHTAPCQIKITPTHTKQLTEQGPPRAAGPAPTNKTQPQPATSKVSSLLRSQAHLSLQVLIRT